MDSDNCLRDDELRSLLESSGHVPDLPRHEDHLATCDVCRRRLESLDGFEDRLPATSTKDDVASPALTRVMRDLLQLAPARRAAVHGPPPTEQVATEPYAYLEPSAQSDSLGRLGKYEILRVIGQGGMGTVFLADDPALDRRVAIKVPTPALVATQIAHDRFVREARALASVKHNRIVTIHAVEEYSGLPFMVMEYVDGQSLAQLLTTCERLEVKDVIRIASETADALAAAHARGLVHRDIKPANILLEGDHRRVKVTDFGLAKSVTDASLTASGIVAGTPEFMSPEQASDEQVTPRSDLFSLGVVMYAALTGKSPFRGKNAISTLRRVCSDDPRPLYPLHPDVPDWLDRLIRQMLSKRPEDRPSSADDVLLTLLQHETSDFSAGAPTVPASPQRTSRRAVWGLGAIFVCLSLGLIWAYRPRLDLGNNGDAEPIAESLITEPGIPVSGRREGFYVGTRAEPFADLVAAIASAANGDVIRVVGDGPHKVPGIDVGDKRLTIRAEEGSSPKFVAPLPNRFSDRPFLKAGQDLTLEGLEVYWQTKPTAGFNTDTQSQMCLIHVTGGNLLLSRCRLIASGLTRCAGVSQGSLTLDGCQLATYAASCLAWAPKEQDRMDIQNTVFQGRVALLCNAISYAGHMGNVTVALTENTFSTDRAIQLQVGQPRLGFHFQATRNIFDVKDLIVFAPQRHSRQLHRATNLSQTRMMVKSLIEWSGAANAYRRKMSFISRGLLRTDDPARRDVVSLADWLAMWNTGSPGSSFAADFEYAAGGSSLITPLMINTEPSVPADSRPIGADSQKVGPE